MKESILAKDVKGFDKAFCAGPGYAAVMNAVIKNGVGKCALNYEAARANLHAFSIEIDSGDACNQMSSGRCWMFAALNVMRLELMKKLSLKNTELSQAYPLFWDKLERSNYFLENVLETLDLPLAGREVSFLLASPVGDGGQWDMFRSLVEKYGAVPKDCMPESEASSHTGEMNSYLTKKLRGFACSLRAGHEAGKSIERLREEKERMLETVYRMLCICLGRPPERVDWETRDKDGGFVRVSGLTPREFYDKYIGLDLDSLVTVINAPTDDKPYGRTYTVKYLGNVRGGKYPVKYLNLPVEELKRVALEQLRDGKTVWFGSDCGQFSDRQGGFFTLDATDPGALFATDFPMDKKQRLDFGESRMTHAMVITGADLDDSGKPVRWKVENSWGKDRGRDGYYVMSDEWFSEYVYQVLLDRKYLSEEEREQLGTEPVVLEPWDPMGSLA